MALQALRISPPRREDREVSRNSIATECADFQAVGSGELWAISDRAWVLGGGETPSMNVMNLMVVALGE
jgi:hypothetical protein